MSIIQDYISSYTGEQIDNFNVRITALESNLNTLQNNTITNINSDITNLEKQIFFKAYYSGDGNTNFTGLVSFNQIINNIGGGTWSAPYYIVPEQGIYLVTFNYYSNNTNTNARPMIARYNSTGTQLELIEVNKQQPTSLTSLFYCNVGDKLGAGAMNSSFTCDFYASQNHNEFIITKIK